MMPAIQDFERRLGILHQVEPILESAIGTLSRVVDLSSPVPAMPKNLMPAPPPPPPPPVVAAPAGPDLGQLKSLLAQAEASQGGGGMGMFAAAAPAPAPAADEMGGLESLLGGLGGGGGGGAGPSGLEALLGGGGGADEAAPAMAAPAFLQAAAPAAPAEAAGGDDGALLARLLGTSLVELDADLVTEPKS